MSYVSKPSMSSFGDKLVREEGSAHGVNSSVLGGSLGDAREAKKRTVKDELSSRAAASCRALRLKSCSPSR